MWENNACPKALKFWNWLLWRAVVSSWYIALFGAIVGLMNSDAFELRQILFRLYLYTNY